MTSAPALAPTLLVCALASSAFAQPFATPQEAVDRMMAATAAADAVGMAGLYAEDALLLIPGQPAVEGRDRIETEWRRAFADGFTDLRISTPENRRRTDAAASVYLWTARHRPEQGAIATMNGRTLLFLEQVEDGWLIAAEMWQPVPDAQ